MEKTVEGVIEYEKAHLNTKVAEDELLRWWRRMGSDRSGVPIKIQNRKTFALECILSIDKSSVTVNWHSINLSR